MSAPASSIGDIDQFSLHYRFVSLTPGRRISSPDGPGSSRPNGDPRGRKLTARWLDVPAKPPVTAGRFEAGVYRWRRKTRR